MQSEFVQISVVHIMLFDALKYTYHSGTFSISKNSSKFECV